MSLYITSDLIGIETGGGTVTKHESDALRSMGPCEVWGRQELTERLHRGVSGYANEPWVWDSVASQLLSEIPANKRPQLAHIYAGTFSETVRELKEYYHIRTSFTAAAHDLTISRREHELVGLPYNYPHITDPELWKRYLQGYLDADLVICPSEHSRRVMSDFGCKNVVVIPHGCSVVPEENVRPLPTSFRVGYLGSYGPDKAVRVLLEAWKKLDYKDATLVLGGRDSTSPWVRYLIDRFGGGNIELKGWIEDVGDFYNDISVYIQPSATEGFGCEVLEAMCYGRPVICSTGAGAVDVVPKSSNGMSERFIFPAGDVDALISLIDSHKKAAVFPDAWQTWRAIAAKYSWDKVKIRYVETWKGLL